MKYRANWTQFKAWLNRSGHAFSCVERESGLYINCSSREELHVTLMCSPSIRADYKKAFKTIELYEGLGVIAIDTIAATRLSKKMRKLKRTGGMKDLILYRDGSGGIVIAGKSLDFEIDAALDDYSKWLENKADELPKPKPSGDEPGGDENPVQRGDSIPGEVSGEERSETTGLQPKDGQAGSGNK